MFLSFLQRIIPRFEVELLVAYVLKKDRAWVVAHSDTSLSLWHTCRLAVAVFKRWYGYPIAYITQTKAFFGLDFFVTKATLVPRPDTEILVEQALDHISNLSSSFVFIDVGTGSGCIPISIMHTLASSTHIPAVCYAIDISPKALAVAMKNAEHHGVAMTCIYGDLLEPLLDGTIHTDPQQTLVITANLPYITHKQWQEEPSIQKEPYTALVAHDQGLAYYYQLLYQLDYYYSQHKNSVIALFEIDPDQTELLSRFIETIFQHVTITVTKDYAGHYRIITMMLP